jgi:DNA-binding LacI/PurR family transcriptional regulator
MSSDTRAVARPNLEDVAARAGVSRATVSRVVNGQASVAPELRSRVEQAVAELGYVPNQAARALMTRRTDTVALVVPEPDFRVFADPFFSDIVRGASLECLRAGLQLVLLMSPTHDELMRVGKFLRSGSVDAFMLVSEHLTSDEAWAQLDRAGIPFVIGGRPLHAGVAAPFVDNDNLKGAAMAARHLTSIGRSVIGIVAGPQDMSAGIDRLAGFRAGMGDRFDADLVEVGDFLVDGGRAAAERLLARVPDLDGIFAASDMMAVGALAALRSAGRRVPDDVAVVGFDDNSFAATTDPPLTTVRQQPVIQGREMVRFYLTRHRRDVEVPPDDSIPDVRTTDHLILPVSLVVRESA